MKVDWKSILMDVLVVAVGVMWLIMMFLILDLRDITYPKIGIDDLKKLYMALFGGGG